MVFDLASYPVWLAAALFIGAVVGWRTYADVPRRRWFDGWPIWGLLAFVVGLVVAVLKLLPGRYGLWLEIALLMAAFYFVGCFLGGWLKDLLGVHEPVAAVARVMPEPPRGAVKAEPERQASATAKAAVDRLAAEAAANAEAGRRAAAAAKAEAERLAAEAAAKAEADRKAAAANAEADRLAAEAAARAEAEREAHPGLRPLSLTAPNGPADDLKLIRGVGPKNEKTLNRLGVYHFSQIADWSPESATWVGHHMAFPGRIERESWIPQAKLLSAGIDTGYSAGVRSGAIKIDDSADAPLSDTETKTLAADLPDMLPSVEGEQSYSGSRPLGLAAPQGGVADDLKLIRGVGPQNEARLHGLGVWHFHQIAAWSDENVKWIGSYLAFPGRIDREEWIAQAKELAAGGKTEFAKRVEAGRVRTSLDDGSRGQGNIETLEPKSG